MTKNTPKAPAGLSKTAAGWWAKLISEYSIHDDAGHLLLETALRSFDRAEAARGAIDKEGMTVTGRDGQTKPHPLLTTERDARAALVRTLGALGVDGGPRE